MPPYPNLRTVLFDLDGTLADTAPDLAYALNRVLEEQGRAVLPYESIRPVVSHGATALIRLGFHLGPEESGFDALRQRLLDIYRQHLARETRLFEGMTELLAILEERGFNWGIVTNKPAFLTDPLVAALGLTTRAACVVSGDTTTLKKPHPQPLLYACTQAGSTGPQCLYVGDAQRDIEAGKRAGMYTLVALFGYIDANDRPADWGADGLVDTPQDILPWIESFMASGHSPSNRQ